MPGRMAAAIVVLTVASVGCSKVASQSSARQWPSWLHECPIEGVAGTARCGTVPVPESNNVPTGRQINLRVVVLPAYDTPVPDPLLPLVGGPGQGAADLAPMLAQRFDAFRDVRDIVLIDQRGTGESNGLHCAPAASASELMGKIFETTRLVQCREELSSRADLTHYTTATSASDYDIVLDRLAYQQVNIVGTSYGSRMALELARRFPARIRTVTIEAVVPPTFDWPSRGAADADAALNAVVDDCEADRACRDAYPSFRQDIDRAFMRVARGRVVASVRDPADGTVTQVPVGVSDLAYATRGLLYGNEALFLPLYFRRAAEGEFEAFAQAYVSRARTLERQIARGLHLSVYCAEDLPFVDQAQAVKAAASTRLGDYLLTQYRRACDVWPHAPIPQSFREPVKSALPIFLMTGRRDPVTPPRTAEDAARTLSRSRVIVWKYGGHGTDGLMAPDCRMTIWQQFLATTDPTRSVSDCVANDPVLPFRR